MPSSSAHARRNSRSKVPPSRIEGKYSLSPVERLPLRLRPAVVTYLHDETDSRLPRRLAEQSIIPNPEIHDGGNNHGRPRSSTGTSLLVCGSQHTSSHDLAALTTSSSLAQSESIPSSFGARQLNSRLLAEVDGGVLVVGHIPTQGNLECPFNFLFCLQTFSNLDDWVKHSMTHFRHVGPPDSNKCCFCDEPFKSMPGLSSWAQRMEHVAYHHLLGCRLAHGRPDFELYNYLWNNRLISDADYRDLKGNNDERSQAAQAYPSPPESPEEQPRAYTNTYSSSRIRRERRP